MRITPTAILLGAITAALLLGPAAAPARAAAALDQLQTDVSGGSVHIIGDPGVDTTPGHAALAQTFTAETSGTLDRVDLYLANPDYLADNIIDVWITRANCFTATDDICPALSDIASVRTLEKVPESGGFVEVDFANPVIVTPGTAYAIVAEMGFNADESSWALSDNYYGVNWLQSSGDAYAGGSQYACDGNFCDEVNNWPSYSWQPLTTGDDFAFRTYVSPLKADLSVRDSAPDTVTPGAQLTSTLTVANAGPNTASAVEVADVMPYGTTFLTVSASAGWSCSTPAVGSAGTVACRVPSLDTGASVSITLEYRVKAGPDQGVLDNIVTVTAHTTDSNPGNDAAWTSTAVVGP